MDLLQFTFPNSGVRTWIFLPPPIALAISFFTSMRGEYGAFMLLPFQVSVLGYHILSVLHPDMSIAPDRPLGMLFGSGGLAGMYLGARCQEFVPALTIKIILCACVLSVALKYVAAVIT